MDFLSVLGVTLGSALFGTVKSYTSMLDGKIGSVIKPLQPLLLTAAGIGLPMLTQQLGIADIDPATLVTAPTTTIAMVTMREGMLRARGKKRSQTFNR